MCACTWPSSANGDQVGRAGVVLVEQPDAVVLHPQRRVADRAVGRRGQRLDHDLQAAVELVHLVADGLEEPGEAELAQLVLELAGRVLRQQHGRLLARRTGVRCAASKWSRCRWRHVQVVDSCRALSQSSCELSGNGNQDAKYAGFTHGSHRMLPAGGVDAHARVPGTRDPHVAPLRCCAARRALREGRFTGRIYRTRPGPCPQAGDPPLHGTGGVPH